MNDLTQQLVTEAKAKITETGIDDAHARLESFPLILDVREPEEFQAGSLPGAINLPRGLLEFRIFSDPQICASEGDIGPLQKQPVLVYCRTGGRSALATRTLQSLGFENPESLANGFEGWQNAGLPVTRQR